ncbi:hypothetical protein GCM10027515_32620 [Schumannella luteola]|uniref:GIY-YIG nuclease family protein n=1 Tax=Schumannella luteola TaxID=472059 RepID=A0A852YIK1_9MICO|nr:hypothetical protein [Schumannella luteola]NYG98938.1 hypothetical protein [Schumannella luteola]TPX06312.1 hypothetical protein FJ656_01335 [Schumannella luteola]
MTPDDIDTHGGADAGSAVDARVVLVRGGRVQPHGSWLYVWVDVDAGAVAYVGTTGFDPELRAHLHLTHPDPALGRVRTLLGDAADGDFDVLAFPIPAGVDRADVKTAVAAELADGDPLPGVDAGSDGAGAAESDLLEITVRRIVDQVRARIAA